MADLAASIREAYAFEGAALDLGRGVLAAELDREAAVRLPLATSNRHGLIAGATGTGKTRTLQLLAEPARNERSREKPAPAPSDPLTDFMTSRQGKAIQREIVRGVFGMLKKRL